MEDAYRAMSIVQKQTPESLLIAGYLQNLGTLKYQLGDLPAAIDYQTRAADIVQRLAPGSLQLSGVLINLGSHHLTLGNLQVAWLPGRMQVDEIGGRQQRRNLVQPCSTQPPTRPRSFGHADQLGLTRFMTPPSVWYVVGAGCDQRHFVPPLGQRAAQIQHGAHHATRFEREFANVVQTSQGFVVHR